MRHFRIRRFQASADGIGNLVTMNCLEDGDQFADFV